MDLVSEGRELRRRRLEAGITTAKAFCQEIRKTAELLGQPVPGVDESTISRLENGKRPISPRYRALIDATLRRTLGDDYATESKDAMRRREFITRAGAASATLLLPAPMFGRDVASELRDALTARSSLDLSTAEVMEGTAAQLSAMFITTPAVSLGPLVEAHLGSLVSQLRDSGTAGAVRSTLASSAAEMAVLSGWLAKDSDDDDGAERRFLAAMEAAEVADDRAIGAYAVASVSMLGPWRRTTDDTIELLTASDVRGFRALGDASVTTRAWVQSLVAEAFARAGRYVDALTALDQADSLLDHGDDGEPRPLDALADAVVAHEGLKIASRYHLARARSFVALGEVDGAVDASLAAVSAARRFEFAPDLVGVREVRQTMPDGEATSRLDEALAAA